MRNSYSIPLYDLYKKARDWREEHLDSVKFLIEDESGIDHFEEGLMGGYSDDPFQIKVPAFSVNKTNIRDFKNDKKLRETFAALNAFRNEWRSDVEKILHNIPQISFIMRFEDPKIDRNTGIRVDYLCYVFSHDMETFLDLFDVFTDEIEELYKIIVDYEKSIYQPSDFEQEQKESDKPKKDVAFRLTYDEISGKLFINNHEVYKCNLESTLDKALLEAFKADDNTAKIKGNLASTKSKIRAPEVLRNLMFSAGKGTFRIKPEITDDDLAKVCANREIVEQGFQRINKN